MIIQFTGREVEALVNALSGSADEAAAAARAKLEACGGTFTALSGEDAVRARTALVADRRSRRESNTGKLHEHHTTLPRAGKKVDAVHEIYGPGKLTLTVKSSRWVMGTFEGDDGVVHEIACAPGAPRRWIAAATEPVL